MFAFSSKPFHWYSLSKINSCDQPTESDTQIRESQETLTRIGTQLLSESKSIAAAAVGEKRTGGDLLSVLVRANMATDLPESQRLSNRDVLARTCRPVVTSGRPHAHCGLQKFPPLSWPGTKLPGKYVIYFPPHVAIL